MLDPRCSIFDAGKGFSIQDRASRIEDRGCVFVPLWLRTYKKSVFHLCPSVAE
ncbi:MAG: hypothetical protein AB1797_02710 [bacterium]